MIEQNSNDKKNIKNEEECMETLQEETMHVQKSPLAEFGQHIEQLYKNGRKSDIENYVISKTLSFEEAALWAEKAPILGHLKRYAEDSFTIPTTGICILLADVDGNGIEDVIEYSPASSNITEWAIANRLIIYRGMVDGSYELSYSQPIFDTEVDWGDIIEVLKYEGETYLLFSDQREQNAMVIYWLSDGILNGKLEFEYQYKDMGIEVKNSAEVEIIDAKKAEELRDKFGQKNVAELNELLKKYDADGIWGSVPNCNTRVPLMSDINNDGIIEEYIKIEGYAWIEAEGIPEREISKYYDVLYGDGEWKYNGRHESKRRLFYYMETSGEETDFLKMCGLDIWERELIPQIFWVDDTEKGNITYITYMDKNGFEKQVDGYLIYGDKYKQVESYAYTPIMECSSHYEYRKENKSSSVDYFTCLAENRQSIILTWGKENELEKYINENIQAAIEEKVKTLDWEENLFLTIGYWPVKATNETFIMDYCIYYQVPWGNAWEEEHTQTYSMEVNLITGECREMASNERSEMKPQDCQQW